MPKELLSEAAIQLAISVVLGERDGRGTGAGAVDAKRRFKPRGADARPYARPNTA